MKIIIALMFVSSLVSAAPSAAKKNSPIKEDDKVVKKEMAKTKNDKLKMLDKKEEDCDDKAKKVVEIKPESISLGGNTGCSLDDAH